MKYIDLHVHSNISDGSLSPSEVVELAYKKNLAAIALTDHDTVKGIPEAFEKAKQLSTKENTFRLIPGVEISAGYKNSDIHILGLFIDYTNPALIQALTDAENGRINRNKKMVQNLAGAGIDISFERLTGKDDNAVITRAHFARYLMEHGYVATIQEAFTQYLNPDTPYYVPRTYIQPADAIHMIQNAGGVPVLAHPLLYHLDDDELNTLLKLLKNDGLKGMEVIYSRNTGNDEAYLRNLAQKHQLLMTGGSDFHGKVKPDIDIGTGTGNLRIPYTLIEAIEHSLTKY